MTNLQMKNPVIVLVKLIIIFHYTSIITSARTADYSCTSSVVGYMANSLNTIKNCTVIHGSLVLNRINLNEDNRDSEIYDHTFVKLREITDYLIIYNVSGITSLATLFPNLVIIRGKKLFYNYALAIYENPNLKEIGLKSLLTIPRGHVFVDHCPELCNLDNIFWNRLTLSRGYSYIQKSNSTDCPTCHGCSYCWSSKYCQLFEGHDLINDLTSNPSCNPDCIGGCYNESSNKECNICKNFKENGSCVQVCSEQTYAHYMDMMCYTAEECIKLRDGLLYNNTIQNECLTFCPYGFRNQNNTCIPCQNETDTGCYIECPGDYEGTEIDSLARIERYQGCHIINNSLIIRILDPIDEDELEINFGEIRVITGHLKIYDSPHIDNLDFLKNLKEVHGDSKHSDCTFAILIYQNKNLTQLWDSNHIQKLKLPYGGIYIDSNPKLCNWEIHTMQKSIDHNKDKDFIFYNDEEIFCDNGTLPLKAVPQSPNIITLQWKKLVPAIKVEIFYREIAHHTTLNLDDDLDKDICLRTSWIKFHLNNYTYENYSLKNLIANTNYAFVVKLYSTRSKLATSQSPIIYAVTMSDLPKPPKVYTSSKMYNLIVLGWNIPENYRLTKIIIEVYKVIDNQTELDKRDFCVNNPQYFTTSPPAFERTEENGNETTSCLYGQLKDKQDDDEFTAAINNRFRCSIDHLENCDTIYSETDTDDDINVNNNFIRKIIVKPTKSVYPITNLWHSTLYIFKVFFCNKIGCGSYSLHTEETNRINDANEINNITVIQSRGTKKFSIKIQEPEKPNGVILTYRIFFKKDLPPLSKPFTNDTRQRSLLRYLCLRSVDLKEKNFTFDYDPKFNYFRISVLSTSGEEALSEWKDFRNFQNVIIDDDADDDSNNDTVISVEIVTAILIIVTVVGIAWYTYRKYPKLKTKIYYNVHEDRVNLIDKDENELPISLHDDDYVDGEISNEMVSVELPRNMSNSVRNSFTF